MIKLSFKKWLWYLSPSLRRWLKDCEEQMNSDEIKSQMGFKNPCLPLYRELYGRNFPNNFRTDFVPMIDKIREDQKK